MTLKKKLEKAEKAGDQTEQDKVRLWGGRD